MSWAVVDFEVHTGSILQHTSHFTSVRTDYTADEAEFHVLIVTVSGLILSLLINSRSKLEAQLEILRGQDFLATGIGIPLTAALGLH